MERKVNIRLSQSNNKKHKANLQKKVQQRSRFKLKRYSRKYKQRYNQVIIIRSYKLNNKSKKKTIIKTMKIDVMKNKIEINNRMRLKVTNLHNKIYR